MFTHELERTWLVISTIFLKMKDFSRSQPVTYTVNVVISQKRWCQIESLILMQTTNRKWYTGLQSSGNSGDLESSSRSFLLQAFQMWFLPARHYASALFADVTSLSVRLSQVCLSVRHKSVCPFVTSLWTTKTAKCGISKTLLQDRAQGL